MPLEVGAIAPKFNLPATGGKAISLADFRGQFLIVYFYTRDDTSGCTKEALGFTDVKDQLDALNVSVVGISKDTIEKHEKFVAKHNIGIPLLSDAEANTCEDFGVWVEKNNYGKKYMGIQRATFLIDPDGKIAAVWPRVKVAGHVEAVLEAAKGLAG